MAAEVVSSRRERLDWFSRVAFRGTYACRNTVSELYPENKKSCRAGLLPDFVQVKTSTKPQ